MNGTFYEQIGGVANIFDSWTVCERTVVLCALLRRVPWSNLKLLKRAIESALMQHANAECQRLEAEANDALLLAKLVHSSEDDDTKVEIGDKLKKLLSYLPLLKPGNDKAKEIYLQSVPIIVQYSVDTAKYTDECQQLLSYLLIHPAVTGQDRRSLSQWLKFLENHISGNSNKDMWYQRIESSIAPNKPSWTNNNVSFRRTIGKNVEFKGTVDTISNRLDEFAKADNLEESFSKNGKEMDLSIDNEPLTFDATITQPKSQRSNSLTPPTPNFIHMSSSAENLNSDQYFVQKPRSFSLSSEHSLASIKPIGVMLATGSETRLDDLKSHNFGDHAGMTTVAQWLKSLRLHKYVWLFSNISYDQMMNMSEEYLQELGVTKGARHKLLLSIKKLKERHALLESMERELCTGTVMSAAGMNQLLEQLRNVIISPMLPASELPKLVVRILELASTRLLSGGVLQPLHNGTPPSRHQLDEHATAAGLTCEPVSLHCWLVERALHHEAFNWSAEILDSLRALRYRLPPKQFFNHLSDLPFTKRSVKPRWRANITTHTSHHKQPHLHTGHPTKRWSTHWLPLDTKQAARGKSSSYPSFPPSVPHASLQPQPNLTSTPTVSASLGDINSRLESLCLQMTEQAIN